MRASSHLHVQGRLLMRVFAIGEVEELLVRHHPVPREGLVAQPVPAADRRVIAGRERERLVGQPVPGLSRDAAARVLQLGEHGVVALRLHDHGDEAVVLRRRPDHRRAADVDVLDRLRLAHVLPSDRALEGVEVHADEVDRLDPLGFERGHVLGVVAHREQGRVQPRMQRLHAAVEDLRRPGELGDVAHLQVGLPQRGGGAPRGDDLHSQPRQAAREIDDPGLVGDGDQGPAHPDRPLHGGGRLPVPRRS